jgi:ribosomal protein S18 acetylase RimI-like enzyme
MGTIELRPPKPAEARACARLLLMSGPDLLSYLYQETEPGIIDLLESCVRAENHTFSWRNAVIEVCDGVVRGLIVAMPVRDLGRYAFRELASVMAHQPTVLRSIAALFRMLWRVRVASHYPKLEKTEYFVANLAVGTEHRRKGVARRLMEDLERRAAESGFTKLSLYVELDNSEALAFYRSFGFQEGPPHPFPESYRRFGLHGFRKMSKDLGG